MNNSTNTMIIKTPDSYVSDICLFIYLLLAQASRLCLFIIKSVPLGNGMSNTLVLINLFYFV